MFCVNYTIIFQNQNPFFSGSTNFFDLKPVPFFKLGLPLSESALPFLNQDVPKFGPLTWVTVTSFLGWKRVRFKAQRLVFHKPLGSKKSRSRATGGVRVLFDFLQLFRAAVTLSSPEILLEPWKSVCLPRESVQRLRGRVQFTDFTLRLWKISQAVIED